MHPRNLLLGLRGKISGNNTVILIWIIIVFISPLFSLWELLFSPGLYSYADQHFSLSTSLPSFSIVYTNPLNGFSFDRLFITWPYLVFLSLTNNLADTIRFFLYYTFVLYASLCFIVAYIASDLYSRKVNPIGRFQKNAGMFAVYILSYSNLSALNLNADGGTWSDGLILLFIVISVLLIVRNDGSRRTYVLISGLMLLSFLLDPDYIPMFWIAVIGASVVVAKTQRKVQIALMSVLAVLVSSVSIAYLYLQSGLLSQLAVSGFNVLGYRDFSPSTVSYFSSNITPFNVFLQFGHIWSTIVYAPPFILQYTNVPFQPSLYSPPQVLLIGGMVFSLWLFALIVIPLVSFSSVIYRSTRKIALSIFLPFIIAYLVTQEWNFRFIYDLLHYLIYVPVFGSAIGTSLSLPGHFLNLMVFLYIPLFSLGLFHLIFYSDIMNVRVRKTRLKGKSILSIEVKKRSLESVAGRPGTRTYLVALLIIALLIIGGWQAFNGSYYPMRASPDSYDMGNSVEPKGVFAPTEVDPAVVDAFNLVTANYSAGFNTLWIGGPTINEFTWATPQMAVSVSDFSYLGINGLYNAAIPYLVAHSVKYVVISNEDIQKTAPDPFTGYGFSNYSTAYSFFIDAGLTPVMQKNNVTVFQVPGVYGPVYYPDLLLNATNQGKIQGSLYGLFYRNGYNISLSPEGATTGFANRSRTINIITPDDAVCSGFLVPRFSGSLVNMSTLQQPLYGNTSMFHGLQYYYQSNNSATLSHQLPGNFSTTVTHGSVIFRYNNGSLLASGSNASFSEGFNGPLLNEAGGVHITSLSHLPMQINLYFGLNASGFKAGTIAVDFIGEMSNYLYSSLQSFTISQYANNSIYHFSAVLPSNTSFFGFRLGASSFEGQLGINFTNFTYSPYPVSSKDTFFGDALPLHNATFKVPTQYDETRLMYIPSNSSTEENLLLSGGESLIINGSFLGAISVKNGTLGKLSGLYATINEPIIRAYILTDSGKTLNNYVPGTDGSYIFTVTTKDVSISVSTTSYVLVAYISLIIFAALLIILYFVDNRFVRFLHVHLSCKKRDKQRLP